MKMKESMIVWAAVCACIFSACSVVSEGNVEAFDSRRTNFDDGWLFALSDTCPAANSCAWQAQLLPHDWSIEGTFSKDNPAGPGGGALPGGIGWYKKTFTLDELDQDKCIYIDFDGVYMNSTVYLNQECLGTRPFGYIAFSYDMTPLLHWDGTENELIVKVDNSLQPNSRWYTGSGIYRHVWLRHLNPVHIAQWGTYVVADISGVPDVMGNADDSENTEDAHTQEAVATITEKSLDSSVVTASLSVRTLVENRSKTDVDICVHNMLFDATGKRVAEAVVKPARVIADSISTVQQTLILNRPQLWSVSSPYMYTLRTEILAVDLDTEQSKPLDVYETPVGIRTFFFDAQRGLFLNGRPLKINGVCMHNDLGCLGVAVNKRAIERQLQILKEMGCNSIRCSHNPPCVELLDLCDRMGFIVMDEAFDIWRKKKTAYDYSLYFNEWHERDLTDLILRDRNHPSILMWSIGNEVLEQWSHADADTLSLEEANLILNFGHGKEMLASADSSMSVNARLTQKLYNIVHSLDTTRMITAACNEPNPKNHLFHAGVLDMIGYNYHENDILKVPENFPGQPFISTETVSALMTRGYYRMPSDSVTICPKRWDQPYEDSTFSCSSYDNCHVPWGTTHEQMLLLVKNNNYVSGQYVWTGFDYIGEPTPYGWPAHTSYFGIVDLAGFPKDIYYLYQSEWRDDIDVLHVFPHWNWQPGQTVDLWAYYNHADSVELFLNDVSQGVRSRKKNALHAEWTIPFEPGTLRAVSRKQGKVVAEQTITTAGSPTAIRLTPDRNVIWADGQDLSFISVEVIDKDGNVCPWADNEISFAVNGDGFIAGVDNGNPISLESFKASHRKAFYGKCLLVVQNDGQAGPISVKALADGLQEAAVEIKAVAE